MVAIDTLGTAKELKAAGFSDGQAEAVVRVVGRAHVDGFSELATKSDVREAELRLEGKLAETRADLLKWAMGAIGVQTLVIVGAVVALAHALGG
jgi:pheromone shutdown protein TraB